MRTYNIYFRGEIRKILCGYPLLSVATRDCADSPDPLLITYAIMALFTWHSLHNRELNSAFNRYWTGTPWFAMLTTGSGRHYLVLEGYRLTSAVSNWCTSFVQGGVVSRAVDALYLPLLIQICTQRTLFTLISVHISIISRSSTVS